MRISVPQQLRASISTLSPKETSCWNRYEFVTLKFQVFSMRPWDLRLSQLQSKLNRSHPMCVPRTDKVPVMAKRERVN